MSARLPAAEHHPSELPLAGGRDDLSAAGRALRREVPRRSHAAWKAPAGRRDPIAVLAETTKGLEPDLVPIRFGRMLQSPFMFFRGAAVLMAADLVRTPATGIRVQACGDCHLLNFGGFATPERRLIFDINDFDETLPAPWEWDLKRLAASFAVAARDKRLPKRQVRDAARTAARDYRRWTAEYAAMPVLQAWYASLDLRELIEETKDPEMLRFRRRRVRKALGPRGGEAGYPKLVDQSRGQPRIRDDPPTIFHQPRSEGVAFRDMMGRILERYRDSLPEERRGLLDRYRFADAAVKVVGIGSVGTLCGVALLLGAGEDPLFLQVKQARTSVLEPYAGPSLHANHGQRVVVGQRTMQAASDVFLGWTAGDAGRHFFVRQLRDVKVKPMVEVFSAKTLIEYAGVCGRALARAHARSGRAAALAGYMGRSAAFDDAVADFALAYADQNERDHAALVAAVRARRVEAVVER